MARVGRTQGSRGARVLAALLWCGAAQSLAWAQGAERTDEAAGKAASEPARWAVSAQFDLARGLREPQRDQNRRLRTELVGTGRWSGELKWKFGVRADYDHAYDTGDHYLPGVRRDQRAELALREAYVDWSAGNDWEFRFGRQQIVWGEAVGLFFADVVSAKDLRQSILQDFDQLRIPQWAARAEKFVGDTHLEFIWLPSPEVDRLGKPGAVFFPTPLQPPGWGLDVRSDGGPRRTGANAGFGARVSTLWRGWDVAAFAYQAPDTAAAFEREIVAGPQGGAPTAILRPRHDRLPRLGATFSKDLDGVVIKGEAVYARGRQVAVIDPVVPSGLVRQDTLDWLFSAETTVGAGTRINGQFFQRAFLDHDPATGLKRFESGVSLMVVHAWSPNWESELLALTSVMREDWLVRGALTWKAGGPWRVKLGVDVFGGHPLGLFGRFRDQDRAYAQVRYQR